MSLLNVGGDRNFRTYIEICRRFGIPWTALCDGAALDPQRARSEQILRQLLNAGVGDAQLKSWLDKPERPATFEDVRKQAERWGIFTLACGPETGEESFESFLERVAPVALNEARQAEPDSKPRQGRYVAEHVACPPSVDAIYTELLSHLGLPVARPLHPVGSG